MRTVGFIVLVGCALCLAACTTNSPEAVAANDRFEPMNRAVYGFDEKSLFSEDV